MTSSKSRNRSAELEFNAGLKIQTFIWKYSFACLNLILKPTCILRRCSTDMFMTSVDVFTKKVLVCMVINEWRLTRSRPSGT